MEITFLGTSSMVPTVERNQLSILISCKLYDILFDCGEGTQRQMKIAKTNPTRIKKIFISHFHGDHTLGLPGLIQTLGAFNYTETLEIYGPKGTKKHIKAIYDAYAFENKLKVEIKELKNKQKIDLEDYIVTAYQLEHSTPCLGYKLIEKDRRRIDLEKTKKLGIPEGPLLGKLQEGKTITFEGAKISPEKTTYIVKGKKIGYIADTNLCENCYKIGDDCDVLISESTFMSEKEENAIEYGHMTAGQAAMVASQTNTKKLFLVHFSQRYTSTTEIENEAKEIFPDSKAAYDFLKIKVE